jgi:hypothetical protein
MDMIQATLYIGLVVGVLLIAYGLIRMKQTYRKKRK